MRNLIILVPAVYLLLARAMTRLSLIEKISASKASYVIPLSIVLLLLSHNIFIKKYYTQPHKQQFREAVNFMIDAEPHYHDNSIILAYVWGLNSLNYYFDRRDFSQRVEMIAGEPADIPEVETMLTAKFIADNPQYLWYISAHRKPSPAFLEYLNQEFALITHQPLIEANVWLFDMEKSD